MMNEEQSPGIVQALVNIAIAIKEAAVLRWGRQVAFRGRRTSTQALLAATFTKIQINSTDYDLAANWDGTNYRWVAPYPCIITFNGAVSIITTLNDRLISSVYKNGVEYQRGLDVDAPNSRTSPVAGSATMVSGDYVELWGWRETAGNVQGAVDGKETNFAVQLIARLDT